MTRKQNWPRKNRKPRPFANAGTRRPPADRRAERAMRRRRARISGNADLASALAAFYRVAQLMADATGVSFSDIVSRATPGTMRRRKTRIARDCALYLTVTAIGIPASRLARALGRPRQRVCAACSRMEDARDRQSVEALLSRLEAVLT